jgi:membrane protein YqaA with SNARE-associated domain
MSNATEPGDKTGVKKGGWLRPRLVPILTILLVIVISVALFVITQRYPEIVDRFESYGYVGVFLISLVSNATVILPVPGILVFIPLLTAFNPVFLGLVGAAGGVIGEITGYMAGYSGRGLVQRSKMYGRVEGWMKRWGIWVVFVFAVAPFLLLDVAGMVAGALRFPLWKFLLVVWVGKSIKYVGLALAAAWGWELLLHWIG